jgi:Raf kinase inhibitor-like YbhB/YbcL family protein
VRRAVAIVLGLLAVAACSSGAGPRGPERELPETITVSSPAFPPQAAIPVRYTCAGEEVSPPLTWSKVPDGTAELALVVDDPDAPGGTYVHWVVAHLGPGQGGLAEGALPAGATQLRNSAGEAAWAGPCPPEGPAHHYRFTVYALARRVEVAAGADPADTIAAIEQAATARGRLVATFAR